MGFLLVLGDVMSYNTYKNKIEEYKLHGLKQFASLYKAHAHKKIPLDQLKWGEEMEYMVFTWAPGKDGKMRPYLCTEGSEYIQIYNESELEKQTDIALMPEYGGWMIEANPNQPFTSLTDPEVILSCESRLAHRR